MSLSEEEEELLMKIASRVITVGLLMPFTVIAALIVAWYVTASLETVWRLTALLLAATVGFGMGFWVVVWYANKATQELRSKLKHRRR